MKKTVRAEDVERVDFGGFDPRDIVKARQWWPQNCMHVLEHNSLTTRPLLPRWKFAVCPETGFVDSKLAVQKPALPSQPESRQSCLQKSSKTLSFRLGVLLRLASVQ